MMIRDINHKDLSACPVCGEIGKKWVFPVKTDYSEYIILKCPQCDLSQTFPLPDDEDLTRHSFWDYYGKESNKFISFIQRIRDGLMKIRSSYYLSLVSKTGYRPNILDIGCAEGRLLKSFLDYGCRCWGIEHKSYPGSRFLCNDRISYIQEDLEKINLPEKSFDLIFIWHVLEHVDDPDAVIRRAHILLKENGILVLAVPNFSSHEATFFKQAWFHLDVPWHKYHFSEKALTYLADINKFSIIKSSSFCIEQNVFGLIQSVLNYMGWPKNELYESIKGNLKPKRTFSLFIQACIAIALLMPCLFLSYLASKNKNGAVLKLIMQKRT
jgi:SAM-dependent methyltransferase